MPEIAVLLILVGTWMLWAYWRWTEGPARQPVPRESGASDLKSSTVRIALREACRTSGDFEAFCLDYHPDVYKRFSSGMERVQMESLLLQHATPEEIERSLQGRRGGKIDA